MTYKLCFNPGPSPVRLDEEDRTVDGRSWAPYDPDNAISKRMVDMGFVLDVDASTIDDKSNPDAYKAAQEVKRLNGETDQPQEDVKEDQPAEAAATVSDNKTSKKAKG